MYGISAYEFEEWALQNASRADLPRLLCCLIYGTCRGVQRLEIPGEEHMFLPGMDGLVICDTGNAFVPSGASAWELSTEKNVKGKADGDYKKRTEYEGKIDKSVTSFVFATPRRWKNAADWVINKESDGIWKQVRGLSSADLATWVETAPWIADAVRVLLGKGVTFRIRTAQVLWDQYIASAVPAAFDAQYILHKRDHLKNDIVRWLRSNGPGVDRVVRISGPSQLETLHFIAASIHSAGEPDSLRLGNRVFFVEDANAIHLLRNLDEEHVIMVDGSIFSRVVPIVARRPCKIIIVHRSEPAGVQPISVIPSIEIPSLSKEHVINHLIRNGCDSVKAQLTCEQCNFDYAQIRAKVFLC